MAIQRVTLAQFSDDLRERWESVPFWTAEEARLSINEALRWWNIFTGTWKVTVVMGILAFEHMIQVPAATLAPLLYTRRVSYLERPLAYSSLFDLDHGRPGWESEHTGMGGDVPRSIRKWAPAGFDRIMIWPAPHYHCTTLTLEGVSYAPQLLVSTDFVDIEEAEFQAILGESLHLAAFKEGGARWESTFRYHREFLAAAADRNARLRSSEYFRRYLGADFGREQHKIREPVEAGAA